MDVTALLLSRIQFAFTVSFHIIYPSFTIGLAAWLTVLEALYQSTGRAAYRVVFEFWLKIFGLLLGLGVVSGIVMAFQFGTNWSALSKMSGPIRVHCCPMRRLPHSCSKRHFSASSSSAGLACPLGSICCRRRWWRWALRSPPSGSWSITVGCRFRSATHGERHRRSQRLGQDHFQSCGLGAISAHADCRVHHRRILRCSHWGLVPAAQDVSI